MMSWRWLLGLGGLAMLWAGRASAEASFVPASASAGEPLVYAREKLPLLLARWHDARVLEALMRWGPVLWPDVPLPALLGLSASSVGLSERVGDEATSGSAVGLFGIEGPTLRAWRDDATTRAALGRSVVSEGPPWVLDVEGQVYLGLRNYRAHADRIAGSLPPAARPRATGTDWTVRLASMGYSVGDGQTGTLVRNYAAALADAADPLRGRVLRAHVAADAAAPTIAGIRAHGRYGAAFTIVRCDQRMECGLALARALVVGGGERFDFGWWGSALRPGDAAMETDLTAWAYHA